VILLRRLLDRRFGLLPARVDSPGLEQAGEAELDHRAERVLECTGLEDVLEVALLATVN
jgi:hypothetical protein